MKREWSGEGKRYQTAKNRARSNDKKTQQVKELQQRNVLRLGKGSWKGVSKKGHQKDRTSPFSLRRGRSSDRRMHLGNFRDLGGTLEG